jgi:tetratricopeptide (TPR) repeat protein
MFRFRVFSHIACCAIFCSTLPLVLHGQSATSTSGATSTPANSPVADELKLGVEAYQNKKYGDAVTHFQKALTLDPTSLTGKLYLGSALTQSIVSESQTAENLKTAQQALDILQKALQQEPDNLSAMRKVGDVYFKIQKWNEAKVWQKKILALSPKDGEANYSIAIIDCQEAVQNALKALQSAGLTDDSAGNLHASAKVHKVIKEKNSALIAESIALLNQSLELQPQNVSIYAYLTKAYRRKADLDWDNESARTEDVNKAEGYWQQAFTIYKGVEQSNLHSESNQKSDQKSDQK